MVLFLLVTGFLLVVGAVEEVNFYDIAKASKEFSRKLYGEIALDKSNYVYSPFSIHLALSMALLGADRETAAELTNALGLASLKPGTIHEAYRELIAQYKKEQNVTLEIANGIFTNPKLELKPQFVSEVAYNYDAPTSPFDLQSKEGPEKNINDFVRKTTHGLIQNIVAKGDITEYTSLVLVDTVFFNGTWEKQFQPKYTAKQEFISLNGEKKKIDFMVDERIINIKKDVFGTDVAEILFKGGRFAFYIALPKKLDGITELEKTLEKPENVRLLLTDYPLPDAKLQISRFTPVSIKLNIPKIKIGIKVLLGKHLKKVGIVQAFESRVANFKKISESGNLSLTEVLHEALIEVQEAGTVAAAVTVTEVGSSAPPKESFVADHPFIFFLEDKQSGQTLFQGKFSG